MTLAEHVGECQDTEERGICREQIFLRLVNGNEPESGHHDRQRGHEEAPSANVMSQRTRERFVPGNLRRDTIGSHGCSTLVFSGGQATPSCLSRLLASSYKICNFPDLDSVIGVWKILRL